MHQIILTDKTSNVKILFFREVGKMSDQKPCGSGDDRNIHDPATNLDDPNDHLSLHNWIDNSVGLERATETNQNANRGNLILTCIPMIL